MWPVTDHIGLTVSPLLFVKHSNCAAGHKENSSKVWSKSRGKTTGEWRACPVLRSLHNAVGGQIPAESARQARLPWRSDRPATPHGEQGECEPHEPSSVLWAIGRWQEDQGEQPAPGLQDTGTPTRQTYKILLLCLLLPSCFQDFAPEKDEWSMELIIIS
jgi:hypothetical protein